MTVSAHRLGFAAAALAALMILISSSGCFSPDYGDGGFNCAPAAGSKALSDCPEGYTCTRREGAQGEVNFVCLAQGTAEPTLTLEPVKGVYVAPGSSIQVRLTVTNFNLVNRLGQPPVDGEGHIHLFLKRIVENNADTATKTPLQGGYLTAATEPVADAPIPKSAPTGDNVLFAALAQNNHTLVDPRVSAELPIKIRDAHCVALAELCQTCGGELRTRCLETADTKPGLTCRTLVEAAGERCPQILDAT